MTGPRIEQTASGATLQIRVAPGAKRERIVGLHGDALKIAVRQPPEGGRANKAVCKLLAVALGFATGDVTVQRGTTGRDKVIHVAGIRAETLRSNVAALLVLLGPS